MSRRLGVTILASLVALAMATGVASAAAPTNPPVDPYPSDGDPYPPTDAVLYFDYSQGGLISGPPAFVIPIGLGMVTVKLVPENLETYAVGYFSDFKPSMSISTPLMTAITQTSGGGSYIWPSWVGDPSPGYSPGEESSYWNGRRYYYEDLPWNNGDKDIDDLWVDIAWRYTGPSEIEIKAVVCCNRAGYLNPFRLTLEREAGSYPVHFTYQVHEPSVGPDKSGQFVLEGSPVSIDLFTSGDVGDWGIFRGSVPAMPIVAIPLAVGVMGLVIRKRRGA